MIRWSLVLMVASTCQGSAAFAQADEAAYCKALADVYMQKVIQTDKPTGQVPWAISKCQVDPAESIGILQKALTDAKVPLPSRQ